MENLKVFSQKLFYFLAVHEHVVVCEERDVDRQCVVSHEIATGLGFEPGVLTLSPDILPSTLLFWCPVHGFVSLYMFTLLTPSAPKKRRDSLARKSTIL